MAIAIIVIAMLVMILDPFGFSTPKQYTANAVSIFAIFLSVGFLTREDEE